jgi:hypothetical protein
MEKIEVFVVILDAESYKTNAEDWLIIVQDTLIHRGTWFTNIEHWLSGFLYALELTEHEVDVKRRWVYDDKIYYNTDINLEEIAEKLETTPRPSHKLFEIKIPGFN